MRCAGCGYWREWHVGKDERCPVCVCGETVGAHGLVAEPPSPLGPPDKFVRRCPGKPTQLRHGMFKIAEPVRRREWFGMLVPMTEAEIAEADAEPIATLGPPLVPARPPYGPHEFAGGTGNKQGVKLGRNATALHWNVSPWYWKAADGSEGCAVRLDKGPMRAVAVWSRKADAAGTLTGWKAEYAYAWRVDVRRLPTRLTHTELEGLIK